MTVSVGFYSGPGNAATGSGVAPLPLDDTNHQEYEVPCPVGYYCMDGVKLACPGGRFGNATRMFERTCSGLCEPGYYCPANSTSPKQVEIIAHTLYAADLSSIPRNVVNIVSRCFVPINRQLPPTTMSVCIHVLVRLSSSTGPVVRCCVALSSTTAQEALLSRSLPSPVSTPSAVVASAIA